MSYTTYKADCQAWICDDDRVPLHRCVGLVDLQVEWLENDACSFSASILNSSDDYDHLSDTADRFLYFMRRDQAQLFCIEYMQKTWILNESTGRVEKATRISGRGGDSFFLWTVDLQPDPSDADASGIAVTGNKDDAIKDFVRLSALVGTAYDDPATTARGIVGLTVAANNGDHPISVTAFARAGNLWNALIPLLDAWDVEATLTPAWNGPDSAITFEFETHYQGRGSDKTEDSADPVILADVYRVISESKWYRDAYGFITHGYTASGREMVVRAGVTDRIRRESRVDTQSTISVDLALGQYDIVSGHTVRFLENAAYQLGTGAAQLWIGDTFTHYNDSLETDAQDDRCTGFRLQYANDAVGSETIELILGDLEPQLPQSRGGAGFPSIDPADVTWYWRLLDDDGDSVYFTDLGNEDNAAGIVGAGAYTTDAVQDVTLGGKTVDAIQIAGPWAIAAGEIYTVTANRDIVSNGGTGTIGQSDDRWDDGFFEDLNVAGTITLLYGTISAPGGNDVRLSATTDDLELDAAGEIRLTAGSNILFSPTGSADELALTSTSLHPGTDEGLDSGLVNNRWANTWSVLGNFEGDITIGAGAGLIYSVVTAGKILVADGTRYVPADLSSIAGHWTVAAGTIYTTVANKNIITNGGTGTIGVTGDRWDGGFFEALAITGTITMAGGTISSPSNDLRISATDDLEVDGAGEVRVTAGAAISWSPLGSLEMFLHATALYPNTNSGLDLGLTTRHWGTLYIGTVVVTGLVDGVDIAAFKTAYDAHTHNYRKITDYTGGGSHIVSSTWFLDGVADRDGNPLRIKGSATAVDVIYWNAGAGPAETYVRLATDGAGSGAVWKLMSVGQTAIGTQPHHHEVDYDDTQQTAGPN